MDRRFVSGARRNFLVEPERGQLDKASASAEFLREILELAQQVTAAERTEDEQAGPHIGALRQIFRE